MLISSSAAEEADGAGIAAGNSVAIRKPFEIFIGTLLRDWVLGPLSRFPVSALKTVLSVGQEILPALKPDKLVASSGQLAMKAENLEVVDLKTRTRLPDTINIFAPPTFMEVDLPRLKSFELAGTPVSSTVAKAKAPEMSSLLLRPN